MILTKKYAFSTMPYYIPEEKYNFWIVTSFLRVFLPKRCSKALEIILDFHGQDDKMKTVI